MKYINAFLVRYLTALMIVLIGSIAIAQESQEESELDLLAVKSYAMIDFDTGAILEQKNPDERLPPASITKLMTAYIVYDALARGNIAMSDNMVTSENAYQKIGSKSFLQLNKPYTVKELIQGVVVQSGNDASISLAEKVAGSEEAFVRLMNEQAERLGMDNTNFTNSTGLPDDDHYSTAGDLAKLAQAMIRDFPNHYKMYSQRSYTLEGITQENRNRLLRQENLQTDDGKLITIDGLKTGHTEAAGYCLVASGKTDDMRLITVVLGAGSDQQRASASIELMQYGFSHFESVEIFPKDYYLREQRIWQGDKSTVWVGISEPVRSTVPTDSIAQLTTNLVLATQEQAPISKGQNMGHIEIMDGDTMIKRVPLVAMESVPKAGLVGSLTDQLLFKAISLFQ